MKHPSTAPLAVACLALLGAALTGCVVATVAHPIGRPATPEDVPGLDGVWRAQDNVAHVKLLDDGIVRVAGLLWHAERQDFERVDVSFLLTVHDEALYLLQAFDPDGGRDDIAPGEAAHFRFMRLLRPDDDSLVLVPANVSAFLEAVEVEAIAGTIHNGRPADADAPDDGTAFRGTWVELEAGADELGALIAPERIGEQFRVEHATVLHRVSALPTTEAMAEPDND